MEFGKGDWKSFEQGLQKEWLLTNGIGGFSSSTIIGANTRRYHGLLVASLTPPVQRQLILSKLDESIIIKDKEYSLYTNKTPDHVNKGYLHLQRFVMDPIPTFTYQTEDIIIEKKICMVHGENKVVILYTINSLSRDCKLRITPLVNFRDYHSNIQSQQLKFKQQNKKDGVMLNPISDDINIFISSNEGDFIGKDNIYYYNMDYIIERQRGLYSIEDHYIPGWFEVDIKSGVSKNITITAGIGQFEKLEGAKIVESEKERIDMLIKNAGYKDDFINTLVKAADHFIVKRVSTDAKTIIAGYPWFTDWGRDTMIALPGLTLLTKRYDDAKEILSTFARHIKYGLVPNVFPDKGEEPAYNTVDASLWFFNAVYKYLQYSGDYNFIKTDIYDKLKQVIDAYSSGTINNIYMDVDGLISAGDINTQLTWMDAKVGDWIVTPRHGKAVEINALWYNALNIMAYISEKNGEDSKQYLDMAKRAKASFEREFWNDKDNSLYDTINSGIKDDKIRPNQIFAISLPFSILKEDKAKLVVETVFKHLYATYGLRSLAPQSSEYKGVYLGDQWERDGAYHQGTAWSWLMGSFITAYRKAYAYSDESKDMCEKFIAPFKDHLRDACIGSISEIFDGDSPNVPRGCFAQAWGVAELLRAYIEDVLERG